MENRQCVCLFQNDLFCLCKKAVLLRKQNIHFQLCILDLDYGVTTQTQESYHQECLHEFCV